MSDKVPANLPDGTTHFCPAFGRYPGRAYKLKGPEHLQQWALWTGFEWFDTRFPPVKPVRAHMIDVRPKTLGPDATAVLAYLEKVQGGVSPWDGYGLPPVGTTCELKTLPGNWGEAEIKYHGPGVCVWRWVGQTFEWAENPEALKFRRPTPTAEQRTAEERAAFIQGCGDFASVTNDWKEVFGMMFDAGYRQVEG